MSLFSDSERLRILADLFDAADKDDIETVLASLDWSKNNNGQVQSDLRRIANDLERGNGPVAYTWDSPH